ncbi:MAG: hypothetical protein Q9162_003219 [Coniocarpon cinnabarinum]
MDAFHSPSRQRSPTFSARPTSSHLQQHPSPQQQPTQSQKQKLRSSCDACGEAKLKCPREHPACQRCINHGIPCVYGALRRTGRRRKNKPSEGGSTSNANGPMNDGNGGGGSAYLQKSNSHTNVTTPIDPTQRYHLNTTEPSINDFSSSDDPILQEQLQKGHMSTTSLGSYPSHNGSVSSSSTNLQWLPEHWLPTPTSVDNMFNTFLNQSPAQENGGMGPADMNAPLSTSMPSGSLRSQVNAYGFDPFSADLTATKSSGDVSSLIDPADVMDTSGDRSIGQARNHNYYSMPGPEPPLQPYSPASSSPPSSVSTPVGVCQLGCFEHITRHLNALGSRTQTHVLLDSIVTIEKETDAVRRKVTSCPVCMNNARIFLLLSMMVEQTIALFEALSDCRFLTGSTNDAEAPNVELALEKCYAEKLFLGNIEVTGETKSRFVKQMIRRRLRRIADMLLDLQKVVMTSRTKNCNKDAAEAIMKDSSHRIELLQGMLELWK